MMIVNPGADRRMLAITVFDPYGLHRAEWGSNGQGCRACAFTQTWKHVRVIAIIDIMLRRT
jgi:hypothetical protein